MGYNICGMCKFKLEMLRPAPPDLTSFVSHSRTSTQDYESINLGAIPEEDEEFRQRRLSSMDLPLHQLFAHRNDTRSSCKYSTTKPEDECSIPVETLPINAHPIAQSISSSIIIVEKEEVKKPSLPTLEPLNTTDSTAKYSPKFLRRKHNFEYPPSGPNSPKCHSNYPTTDANYGANSEATRPYANHSTYASFRLKRALTQQAYAANAARRKNCSECDSQRQTPSNTITELCEGDLPETLQLSRRSSVNHVGFVTDDSSNYALERMAGPLRLEANNEGENHLFASGRIKGFKTIENYMSECAIFKTLCSGTACSENLALPSMLSFDPHTAHRSILNQRQPTIFHHMASFHNKFGVRHFVLIALLTVYTLAGGLMFQALEAENELVNLNANHEILHRMMRNLSSDIFRSVDVTPPSDVRHDVFLLIRKCYQKMLEVEGRYGGSVFHKYERTNLQLSWFYGNSVFYAMSLFTTIGYGCIACQTALGKAMSVIYAMVGIPLMLVVLNDLGLVMLRFVNHLYSKLKRKCQALVERRFCTKILRNVWSKVVVLPRRRPNLNTVAPKAELAPIEAESDYSKTVDRLNDNGRTETISDRSETDESEDDEPPPTVIMALLVLLYVMIVALFVHFFDYDESHGDLRLCYGNCVYFVFLSLSTIGLGDVMPNNIEYSPVLFVLLLIGLAMLSLVNCSFYQRIEAVFLGMVDRLEEYLEAVHYHRHGTEGYFTFRSLGPNMQLLALALPIFDDADEEKIEAFLEPDSTRFGQKFFTKPRAATMAAAHSEHHFRPTLGIWNSSVTPPTKLSQNSLAGNSVVHPRRHSFLSFGSIPQSRHNSTTTVVPSQECFARRKQYQSTHSVHRPETRGRVNTTIGILTDLSRHQKSKIKRTLTSATPPTLDEDDMALGDTIRPPPLTLRQNSCPSAGSHSLTN